MKGDFELLLEIWSKWFFLKATWFFWQLSTDSMLLLLSLSSTEKQEAQNQFGLGVGWGERAVSRSRVWSTLCDRRSLWTWPGSLLAASLSVAGHTEKFFCTFGVSGSLPRTCFCFFFFLMPVGCTGQWSTWGSESLRQGPAMQWISYVTLISPLASVLCFFTYVSDTQGRRVSHANFQQGMYPGKMEVTQRAWFGLWPAGYLVLSQKIFELQ